LTQALVAWTYHSPFSNFLFTNFFTVKFLHFFIFHLFFLMLACSCQYSYNLMLTSNCMCRPYIDTNNPQGRFKNRTPALFEYIYCTLFPLFPKFIWNFCDPIVEVFETFVTLSLKLMQWYVTSVIRGSLYEIFGNKCGKILKFWRTELSYAQNKNRLQKDASFRNGYMS
jgi:hypothetical protein